MISLVSRNQCHNSWVLGQMCRANLARWVRKMFPTPKVDVAKLSGLLEVRGSSGPAVSSGIVKKSSVRSIFADTPLENSLICVRMYYIYIYIFEILCLESSLSIDLPICSRNRGIDMYINIIQVLCIRIEGFTYVRPSTHTRQVLAIGTFSNEMPWMGIEPGHFQHEPAAFATGPRRVDLW